MFKNSHCERSARRQRAKGFTLAEVLITLGIIGIVAAMTMPALIEHHQKKVTVNSLKKMYTTLMQAAQRYQADNGVTFEEFDTSLDNEVFMQTYFLPYLKTIKKCTTMEQCYGQKTPLAIDRKTPISAELMYILPDGSFIGLKKHLGGRLFYFDLDGAKGSNLSGRDIFYFFLINTSTMETFGACGPIQATLKSGIYPGGYGSCYVPFTQYKRADLLDNQLHRTCNHNAQRVGDSGDACAALIMLDGWEIKDDYPW